MKLFLISTDDFGYDEYDGFVISANTADDALNIATEKAQTTRQTSSWEILEIGTYSGTETKIILKSFNAG